MKIFDLSLQINGFPIRVAKAALSKILAVPEDSYADFIDSQKNKIVQYHLQNNAFYKSLAGSDVTKWEDLPIMTKLDYQRPLNTRLSKGFNVDNVYVNKTSGSGGHPMVFAKDKMCHAMIWANIIRRFQWYDIDFNNSLQARFYGRPIGFIDDIKLKFKDFLSSRHRFNIFDLSDAALANIVQKFASKKFEYINGYTTAILLVAKYLQRNNLVLKQICPTLKVCVVTSEMLFESDRLLLEKYLGVPVVNEYGASELDIIAFANPEGQWQINSENLFVEIVDEQGRPLANGIEGRIVITALNNLAHPFIRYDVGDYGIMDKSSTAKTPILQKLTGRTNDVAILPSGKKPAGMTFYSITKALFDDDGNVKEFAIRQTKIDQFEIDYTSDTPLSAEEIKRMEQIMTEYLEPGLRFNFNRKDVLHRSKSGKLKQFTSMIDDNLKK